MLLEERIRIGGWEAIPAAALELGDCASQHAFEQVKGLLDLYRRPHRVPEGSGCFLRRRDARIGVCPAISSSRVPFLPVDSPATTVPVAMPTRTES